MRFASSNAGPQDHQTDAPSQSAQSSQSSQSSHASLSAELAASLLRELGNAWHCFNWEFFREALLPPSLELTDADRTLGRWIAETRTLEISCKLAIEQRWGVVLEVLKHEMAHQYVHEVLRVVDESAHGPAFVSVCKRFGIDAAAQGMPDAPSKDAERILERIAKLLALAESSNAYEAEAAMAAAQKLMLKHNLEHQRSASARSYAYRHVGTPTTRVTEGERVLASLLTSHFFVAAIRVPIYLPLLGKRAKVLELCGTKENLDIAEYVHQFLTRTAERLWVEHRKKNGIRGNRDRRTFVAGVMSGFAAKLEKQSGKHRSEGLVWVKDADLERFYRQRHPHIHSVRFGGSARRDSFAEGRAAGETIVLHRGFTEASTSKGLMLTK
ncbi:MAG: hypothetical protein NVS3B20_02110 [Polyangiales bacterium]